MSIFSVLLHDLEGGTPPADAWSKASGDVVKWEGQIMARAPAAAQLAVQSLTPIVKQGLSDVIALADTALADILPKAADAAAMAFTGAVTTYLGPVAAGALTPVGRDGIYKIRDMLVHAINAEALAMEAQLTTSGSAPPAPPQPGS